MFLSLYPVLLTKNVLEVFMTIIWRQISLHGKRYHGIPNNNN